MSVYADECLRAGSEEREAVEVGFHSTSNRSVSLELSHFSFDAAVAYFQRVAIMLFILYVHLGPRVQFKHHAGGPQGDSEEQPSLGSPFALSSATLSPHTPTHYVAFSSYRLRKTCPPSRHPHFFFLPLGPPSLRRQLGASQHGGLTASCRADRVRQER